MPAPKVTLRSFSSYGDLIYMIGNVTYEASGLSPFQYRQVERMVKQGQHGKAINLLKNFNATRRGSMKETDMIERITKFAAKRRVQITDISVETDDFEVSVGYSLSSDDGELHTINIEQLTSTINSELNHALRPHAWAIDDGSTGFTQRGETKSGGKKWLVRAVANPVVGEHGTVARTIRQRLLSIKWTI